MNAITIREDDRVVGVCLTNGEDEIVLANRNGRAIRFNEDAVRAMGRTATGVKGMTLDEHDETDEVVGMICINDPERETILVVSETGFGKRSLVDDYRVTNRGGKGVKTISITEKTGKVVAIKSVTDENDLMIINKNGITIRLKLSDVRVMGRATQGVKLIDLGNAEVSSRASARCRRKKSRRTMQLPVVMLSRRRTLCLMVWLLMAERKEMAQSSLPAQRMIFLVVGGVGVRVFD